LINEVLTHKKDFREYVVAYTNAPTIINEDFVDAEDLEGLFSGFDAATGTYDNATWQSTGETDPTLQHPRCVYQLLNRHFGRYTPEMVEDVCGIPKDLFQRVADALTTNSGRDRTSAFCYSVGWTQHTVGVQYIRAAAILQLLLGNIGRPGGGILALRGHASIQGSTDIPTLFNLLPGYLPMPEPATPKLSAYVARNGKPAGYWGHVDAYLISLLKAWWGDSATKDNDFCFDYLPHITGDHSHYQSVVSMLDGTVKGYFVIGENPAVGSANAKLQRLGLAKLDWLVVRDFSEIETAAFWYDSPEIESGELQTSDIATEVFFLPAAAHTEKDGSFTNTQRTVQWHHTAVEPQGDARSELWFYFHLGRILREKLATSADVRDRPLLDLAWDYPTAGALNEPSADVVLQEINGRGASGGPLSSFTQLTADGSTACGCWIYCGCYADGINQTARRKPGSEQHWVAPEWGWSWPANRRLLYNRASADPDGKPWSERKKYVWWDEDRGEWTGVDVPDFHVTMRPDYRPPDGATAELALSGAAPFVMQPDGKGWLFAPTGLVDGPLPAHYEPHESPVSNRLYRQQASPTRQTFEREHNERNPRD
ncbi:MAG TPA: molybdopterin-dependent oxidoreductase, partial [Acidimicrobiales bacterium]|nr:molybdopterin-dependent oxidoreductase [Acidimicrobiales bacterium]